MRAAQLQARGRLFTPAPSGLAASGTFEAMGSGATRPYLVVKRLPDQEIRNFVTNLSAVVVAHTSRASV